MFPVQPCRLWNCLRDSADAPEICELNWSRYEIGTFGYSSLACGFASLASSSGALVSADKDCGVLFDNGDRLLFLGFNSADVK